MPTTIFTLGYQQRSLTEFIEILRAERIDVVLDVRETAWSHKPGFSKSAFASALADAGIEYIHADFAGNPKWLRGASSSHRECLDWYAWYLAEFAEIVESFDELVGRLCSAGRRVCLTCFERHADDCHRSVLADAWAIRGRRAVLHLAVDGCRRLA